MAKKKGSDDRPGLLTSFVGGLLFTLILVLVIPVVCNHFIQPVVEDIVGDNAVMWLSSSLIVTLIMLLFMILFMVFLGGGAILKRFGIVGVIALVAAYWLLGNLPGAVIPVLCIILMAVWEHHREKK